MRSNPLLVISLLSIAALVGHLAFALAQSTYSFPDDLTYVSSVVNLLEGKACAPQANNVCNYEHPPLAKLLIAIGSEVFGGPQAAGQQTVVGISQFGGRLFQVVMSSASAPMLFLLVRRLSGNGRMAFVAAVFLLVDPLYTALSTTLLLDNAMLFFALAAMLLHAYRAEFGKGGLLLLTGAFLGLSLLSKETAVFVIGAFVSYLLVIRDGGWRRTAVEGGAILLSCVVVFILGLEVFDLVFTRFPSFISHLQVIIQFQLGAGRSQLEFLTQTAHCAIPKAYCPYSRSLLPYLLNSRLPPWPISSEVCQQCWAATNPLDWLTYVPPVVFPTDIILAVNYPLVWLSFAWVPIAIVQISRLRVAREGRVLILALLIFLWNIASNIWIFEGLGRAVFEWYFLPAVPGLAMGGAYLVTRPRSPKWLAYAIIASVISVAALLSPLSFQILFHG